MEMIYRSTDSVKLQSNGLYTFVSEEDQKQGRRVVLEINREASSADVLRELISKVDIISYRELIPRMNDIFIKLVS